jgi:hypothetical protein
MHIVLIVGLVFVSGLPSDAAISKAKQQAVSLYGADIKKAKKPSEKMALAAKLLETANKMGNGEADKAGCYVLIDMAKSLAIETDDKRGSLETETMLVEQRFSERKDFEAVDVLHQGELFIKQAQDATKIRRLELQMQAAECFLLAKKYGTGLEKQIAERRLDDLNGITEIVGKTMLSPRQFVGKWKIQHWPNQLMRHYIISKSGDVHFIEENRNGTLYYNGPDLLLDFGDGKIERLNLSGNRLFIEHFNPKGDFSSKPDQIGIGKRLD